MPAINIHGTGGGTGGLQAAIEALTSAVKQASGNFGTGGGGGGGKSGGIFGSRANRADARWMDSDYNARTRFQQQRSVTEWRNMRNEAAYDDRDHTAKRRWREQRDTREWREMRAEASYEDRDHTAKSRFRQQRDTREWRDMRADANYEDRDHNARSRHRQQQADKERRTAEQDAAARYRAMRQDADYLNRQRDLRTRASVHADPGAASYRYMRSEADFANRGVNAAAAANYRFMRSEADYMNRQFDRTNRPSTGDPGAPAYRNMRADADFMNRQFDRGQGAHYRSMRAEADHMNRQFDLGAAGGAGKGGQAFALARAIISAPFWINNKVAEGMAKSAPYTDLRMSTAMAGRGGNFNSLDLMNSLFPGHVGNGLKTETPPWLATLQMQPEEVMSTLGTYGISPRNADDAEGLAKSFGRARMMPFLGGMGLDAYAQMGRTGSTLGLTGRTPESQATNMDTFFRKYQVVTAAAVSMGLDRSQSIENVNSLLRAQASGGSTALSADRAISFWGSMANSGMASMRTGEGQLSMQAGADRTAAGMGLGGDTLSTTMIQRYTNKVLGGRLPTTFEDVEKIVGPDIFADLMSTDLGKRQVGDVIAAGKSGSGVGVQTYLAPLLQGQVKRMAEIAMGSGMVEMGGPSWRAVSLARLMNWTLPQAQAFIESGSTSPMVPAGLGSTTLRPATTPMEQQIGGMEPSAIPNIQEAAARTGLPVGFLAAVTGGESAHGFNISDSKAGAIGLMQVMPGTYADVRRDHPELGLGPDPRNPRDNALAGATYLKEMIALAGGDPVKGLELYNWGPGKGKDGTDHLQAVMSGRGVPRAVQNYAEAIMGESNLRNDPNSFGAFGTVAGNAGQLRLSTAQLAWGATGAIVGGENSGGALLQFSGAANVASAALVDFTAALKDIVAYVHREFRSPGRAPGGEPRP